MPYKFIGFRIPINACGNLYFIKNQCSLSNGNGEIHFPFKFLYFFIFSFLFCKSVVNWAGFFPIWSHIGFHCWHWRQLQNVERLQCFICCWTSWKDRKGYPVCYDTISWTRVRSDVSFLVFIKLLSILFHVIFPDTFQNAPPPPPCHFLWKSDPSPTKNFDLFCP